MKIFDFFTEAYYINVDTRLDRKIHIENELNKYNLLYNTKRFEAIKPINKTPENCARAGGSSHRSIVQLAKDKNLKNILIFEDDIYLKNNGLDIIESSLDSLSKITDWDLFYFSANIFDNPLKLISKNLLRIDGCYCIHAYGINSRAYDKILNYSPENDPPLDAYITINSFNKYSSYPLACSQIDGVSDNVGGYISYDNIFNNVYSRPIIDQTQG